MDSELSSGQPNPQVGMFAAIRNRQGVIAAVSPCNSGGGERRLHLVRVEYKDHGFPLEESLIWEREPHTTLLPPSSLPDTDQDPMKDKDFDALLRASRWCATTPYLLPGDSNREIREMFTSPLNGLVQIEDYQMVPLLKALQMPRVNLLLADDVGLGKTVEACLILTELLLRRRIQRILILTPASLKEQWRREELWERFSLRFEMVDKRTTYELKRDFGMDANPWRSYQRIISSFHYLRQEDVLEQFLAASQSPEGSPLLPWDLLIVDECHNLMPAAVGEDSDLCKMLRRITPLFEHRLFLSATPHNGFTSSFTGLLEILDPVRFSQTSRMTNVIKERISQVVIRRLKSDINADTNPPKFCSRSDPSQLVLSLSSEELSLVEAFRRLRAGILRATASAGDPRRGNGHFAIEIFNKRLLSCPTAFAVSWQKIKDGLVRGGGDDRGMKAVTKQVNRDSDDDRERQKYEEMAAEEAGAWLRALETDLASEIISVDQALKNLGLDLSKDNLTDQKPYSDARFTELCKLIDRCLRSGGEWKADERVIVFTEYKTTLDYLVRRLQEKYGEEAILDLFGGMRIEDREMRKARFNDINDPVRVLIATDAASEGLNLQRTSRYLLHYDCPWNPAKLEQRNGRLDRHGQARNVTIFHFFSTQDDDLKFLAHVIKKAHSIRSDLGSANQLFSEALRKKLIEGKDTEENIAGLSETEATDRTGIVDADRRANLADSRGAAQILKEIRSELDMTPKSLRDTLTTAMGKDNIKCSDDTGLCKIVNFRLRGWEEVINESARQLPSVPGTLGPLREIAFSPIPFLERIGGREIFNMRPHIFMAHLSHPLMQKALSVLTRWRFPGTGSARSRWIVRLSDIPPGVEAQMLLSVEELAVNRLRETFHHWVTTHMFTVENGEMKGPDNHCPPAVQGDAFVPGTERHVAKARNLAEDHEQQLGNFLKARSHQLTDVLEKRLAEDYVKADAEAKTDYQRRSGEISDLVTRTTVSALEREIADLRRMKVTRFLFDEAAEYAKIESSIAERQAEIDRRKKRHDDVRLLLEKERDRTINQLLPNRHKMDGNVFVYPVSLEIRFPR